MSDLENCRRLLDAAAQTRTAITTEDIERCRAAAQELRQRGLVDGAVSIEDRLRLLARTTD